MSSTDQAYFGAIPWCAAVLNDPNWTIITTRCRIPKPNKSDEFFAKTLQTDDTISACVTQIRFSDHTDCAGATSDGDTGSAAWQPPVSEARTLFALSAGVNGFAGVAHGGIVASLLDEVMGFLITANRDHQAQLPSKKATSPSTEQRPLWATTVTAELNVKYRAPVLTGRIVLVRAWFKNIQGGRIAGQASIEDDKGRVLSEGAGLFVSLRPGKEKAFRASPGVKI